MKRNVSTSFLSAAILLLGCSTSSLALDIPEQVDINLQSSNPSLQTLGKDSKTVPAFSHAKHAGTILQNHSSHVSRSYDEQFSCTACHPGAESAETVHSEAAQQKQVKEVESAGSVKKYMHALCLDCHKSMKKAELATGPTSCRGCHNPA
jgi:hypothetical protein